MSDGIDIDISDVTISGGSIRKTGNDCLDFMGSKVTVENIILSDCGDKGISIGEASRSLVTNSKINRSNIGIESKDGSKIQVLHTDFVDNKIQINAYKKIGAMALEARLISKNLTLRPKICLNQIISLRY